VITGKPLYSFTLTHELTGTFGRATGLGAIPIELPRTIGRMTRPGVALGAVVGLVLALRTNRATALRLLGLTATALAATALIVAAGTPLNGRYLFLGPVVACIFCGAAIGQLTSAWRPGQVAGALVLLGAVLGLVHDAERITGGRDSVAEQRAALAELHAFADRAAASRCSRIVAHSRAAPYLSLWRDAPAPRFLARGTTMPPAAVITPTRDATAQTFANTNRDRLPGGAWRSQPPDATGRYWVLRLAC